MGDNVRYVMPAEIALLWLIVRDEPKQSALALVICFLVLFLMSHAAALVLPAGVGAAVD